MLATVARMLTAGCVALSCLTFVLGYTLGRVARRRTRIETRWNDQATFATLHLAAMAAPALRTGLTRDSATITLLTGSRGLDHPAIGREPARQRVGVRYHEGTMRTAIVFWYGDGPVGRTVRHLTLR